MGWIKKYMVNQLLPLTFPEGEDFASYWLSLASIGGFE